MRTLGKIALWLSPVVVVLIVLMAIPFSRYHLLGIIRGESFHESRPVSYWAYLLQDGDEAVRKEAVFNLGQMGEDSHSAESAVAGVLQNDPSDEVRFNAALALFKIKPESQETIDILSAALEDPHPQVRLNSAIALSRAGPNARTAVPQLLAALKRPENQPILGKLMMSVRQQVIRALGSIGPDAREAIPALTEALHDKWHIIRLTSSVALGKIGRDAKPALPELRALSSDEFPDVRKQAERAAALIEAPEEHH
jgi:HEAT repeat protein